MLAIYDNNVNLVAWLSKDGHLFDVSMKWVAFVVDGHFWAADTGNWLGALNGTSILDREGRVVGWNRSSPVSGSPKPIAPLTKLKPARPTPPMHPRKPATPAKPEKPFEPLGGWSPVPWHSWLRSAGDKQEGAGRNGRAIQARRSRWRTVWLVGFPCMLLTLIVFFSKYWLPEAEATERARECMRYAHPAREYKSVTARRRLNGRWAVAFDSDPRVQIDVDRHGRCVERSAR